MKLTWTNDGDLSISVAFDRWDSGNPNRAGWNWSIDCAGETLASGDDLYSPATGRIDAADALRSLASFLGAWDESWVCVRDGSGENADLFPASLRDLSIDWETVAYDLGECLGAND